MTKEKFKELVTKEFFESGLQLIDLEDGIKVKYRLVRDIEEEYSGSKRSGQAGTWSDEGIKYQTPETIRLNCVLMMAAQFRYLAKRLTEESEELRIIVEAKRIEMQENLANDL